MPAVVTHKKWLDQVMLSLFKQEATYDAGVTMNATNACSMREFEAVMDWPDEVIDDGGEITGSEGPTKQEIIFQAVNLSYKQARATPNTLIGLAALTLGNIVSTQDGAYIAYRHKNTRIAVGSALPSIQAEAKSAGIQYKITGLKSNTLKISGDNRFVSVESNLIGSGSRAASTTAFVAAITESWLKVANCKVFLENGANISIDATLTQGLKNISSGTPADIGPRFKNFELSYDNQQQGIDGYGGAAVFQDMHYGTRKQQFKFSLLFKDDTELNYYLNQTPMAIELDLKGGLIAAGGTLYYGCQIIVPKFQLKVVPHPKGERDEFATADYDCTVLEDGTNSPFIIEGYNAKAGYLL